MKDIIKIRVWGHLDGETKYKMFYGIEHLTMPHYNGYKICLFEQMLSMGLKDKNKTLIYDGDIVQHKNKFGDGLGVVFISPKNGFALRSKNSFCSEIESHECEIIGNKYENPELRRCINV